MRLPSALAALSSLVVPLSLLAVGCSSPLASRRAQVMEPGELEVSLVPYGEGTMGFIATAPVQPIAYPFAEATARFGVVDRVDLQLKVDPTVIPEVNVAVQLLGDPSKDGLAFTVSGGVKPTVLAMPGVFGGLVTTPLEAIVDVPIGESAVAVAGLRIIPAYVFAGTVGAGVGTVTVAPGAFGALHMKLGDSFFVRPEVAVNGVVPLVASAGGQNAYLAGTGNTVNVVAALGIGATFDFRKPQDPPATHEEPAHDEPAGRAPNPLPSAPVAPMPAPAPLDPAG